MDGCEDFVGGFGPSEGFRIGIVGIDEGADICLELLGGSMHTAPDLLVGDQSEKTLDLIDPGRPVGVKCTCQRGRFASQSLIGLVLCLA